MTDEATKSKTVVVIPPKSLPPPPYANVVYTFNNLTHDISLVFMRIPLMQDKEMAEALKKDTIEGEVVTSVTMPRNELREYLTKIMAMMDSK